LIFLFVPESRDEQEEGKLDVAGAALATLALGGIVFGLIESSRLGFRSPLVIGTTIAGLIMLALFLLLETRVQNPMMPLTLFRSRNFAGANLLTLFLYAAWPGPFLFP
jgi:hypothetical protein